MAAVEVRSYLILTRYAVQIEDSDYPGVFRISDSSFYISRGVVAELDAPPEHAPPGCDIAYRISEDQHLFEAFYEAWLGNNAMLYRGFPGCHFSLPNLMLTRSLESEGHADVPTFTMGNGVKTRWLPTAPDHDLCAGVALQCTDQHTAELATNNAVPLGFVVQLRVGNRTDIPIAWMNAGEIVVRGPLQYPAFEICTIVWLDHRNPRNSGWPNGLGPADLPPIRPYQPGPDEIAAWWIECTAWLARMQIQL
jgi:hypothetical protein